MARPPLPVGTHGKIKVNRKPGGGFVAKAKYRDYDGVTRLIERSGHTETAARNRLLEALRDRSSQSVGGLITGDTKFSAAADLWLREVNSAVEAGDMSPSSADLYERQIRNYVTPALGELRIREVTTPRVDALLQVVRKRRSAATAKVVRSVVSGVMGLAARHGATATNPTRETKKISSGRKRSVRALTADERVRWLAQLEADPFAVRKDLPDLTRFMLATGVRIGEALAVSWDEVDLDARMVDIEWTLVRVRGAGLRRIPPKTDSGRRTLPLPLSAVEMLRRRKVDAYPDGALAIGTAAPIFPDVAGGWRDPSNTRRDLRTARGTEGFGWVTSHVFRKTCATILDEARFTPRQIADQLGHARPSLTQDVYVARKIANPATAEVLNDELGT
ncbi:site-specific recombinase XerC [Saccharomonospora marina XMU15]|uniref:Site-specific recombinase XerC n=1 Tax=Saccharomonospora marina XMU15 TaxID=882083 RepID=H5X3S5_9PSEU|nr:site-specific integrase [Saccharomonospora marina]EHR52143.1 site-specific recombinase XerC [Saccharomonospora marina XMU15]